ncbi:MAG TPA: hypothetical protein VN654_24065 [Vicinamibacterales bacterium]|nr:hypothetical protein [Vicinamibacterales bacterium]
MIDDPRAHEEFAVAERCTFCGMANYGSADAARRGMRNFQRRHPKERLHVYFCREGRAFHVGHVRPQ